MPPKPPLIVDLQWTQAHLLAGTSGGVAFSIDGDSTAGLSPVQMLGAGLAGCMSIDVIDILRKGRHPLRGFEMSLQAERAPDHPHRILSVRLHFVVRGDVPAAAIERAIALSHDKYCSVWHSLRQDIGFSTSYDVVP
jgi:putative redox protein